MNECASWTWLRLCRICQRSVRAENSLEHRKRPPRIHLATYGMEVMIKLILLPIVEDVISVRHVHPSLEETEQSCLKENERQVASVKYGVLGSNALGSSYSVQKGAIGRP